ncbi:hypothetical protein H5410_044537 [Solanum commersonii]|uniref:DUF4283 domain-containing protein n=1 Tax=Solanum commersonii TaxID=4109 RepID=A0A9J5X8T8_SOLCO|nr:hypothetical protein H5410_044537 [Solanum commersonii]
MGDDAIFFAVGFKSYDITRVVSRAETWYDWVERGRRMMTRMSISQKTMEWLAYTLKEASKSHGNTVRRWKRQDHFTEIFYARNYNKFGRYISIIKVQDKKRDVIIIPEWSLNSGWMDIATKISVFINAKGQPIGKTSHRKTEKGLLYSDIVRNNKWSTRELNGARFQQKGNSLIISDAISTTQNESLAKSVVGSLPEEIPGITLSEIRRWVASTWRHNHGINIFELGGNRFLFEFPNRTAADHIFSVRSEISVEAGSVRKKRQNYAITSNGLGLKVRGDGESIPSTVELTYGDLTFKVQIWVETPARVISDERRGIPINTQRSEEVSSQKGEDSLLGFTEVTGHVGSSYDPKISKWPAGPARDITCTPRAHHSILPKKAILVNKGKKLGPDILAQSISNGLPAETSFSLLLDPFVVELEANLITSSSTTPHQAEELVTAQGLSLREEEILKEKRGAETAMGNIVDTSEIIWQRASTCIQGSNPQSTEVVSTSLIPFEEAVLLNQLSPEEGDDPEFDVPIWIHQNINKLAKEFGVDIKGCKDEALSLFMKIDGVYGRSRISYEYLRIPVIFVILS